MGLFASIEEKEYDRYSKIKNEKGWPLVKQAISLQQQLESLSDDELKQMTLSLRERYQNTRSLDKVRIDAMAVISEAFRRTSGIQLYEEQLLASTGYPSSLVEMKTGEGKTFVFPICSLLSWIEGKKVHVITANSYLARRDAELVSSVLGSIGIEVGLASNKDENADPLSRAEQLTKLKPEFQKDVVYTDVETLAFAYLGDHAVQRAEDQILPGKFETVLVDEVDQVLIDEALTPMISASPMGYPDELYIWANQMVERLKVGSQVHTLKNHSFHQYSEEQRERFLSGRREDPTENKQKGPYQILFCAKDHTVEFTDAGEASLQKAKAQLRKMIQDYPYDDAKKNILLSVITDQASDDFTIFLKQALHAHFLKTRAVDYDVDPSTRKVVLIEGTLGRYTSTTFSEGLHQAIEAKEGLKITKESYSTAEIARASVIGLYDNFMGLSGTVSTSAKLFKELYGLQVMKIAPHKPKKRADLEDDIVLTKKQKYQQIVAQVKDCQQRGQPILVGVTTIQECEEMVQCLRSHGIDFQRLNARNEEKEAEIVSDAGRLGAVTIVTNMAGRGTDIKLGGDVEKEYQRLVANYMKSFISQKELEDNKNYCIRSLQQNPSLAHTIGIPEKLHAYAEKMLVEALISKCEKGTADPKVVRAYEHAQKYFRDVAKAEHARNREAVLQAGGLYVLSTVKNNACRIDDQLKGRSGRQGEPGTTRTILSLEDDFCVHYFKKDKLARFAKDIKKGKLERVRKEINEAQENIEMEEARVISEHFSYDQIDDQSRNAYYRSRDDLLNLNEVIEIAKVSVCERAREDLEQLCPEGNISNQALKQIHDMYFPMADQPTFYQMMNVQPGQKVTTEEIEKRLRPQLQKQVDYFAAVDPTRLAQLQTSMLEIGDQYWHEYLENRSTRRHDARLLQQFQQLQGSREYLLHDDFSTYNQAIRSEMGKKVAETVCPNAIYQSLAPTISSAVVPAPAPHRTR